MRSAGTRSSRGFIDWFLSAFAPVAPGEGGTVLLLMFNIFVVLTSYYIIKPVRDALILASGSAELKSYLSAATAVALVGIVPLYGLLAERVPRARLITIVLVFFAANLGLFYLFSFRYDTSVWLAAVFFVWAGIFNLMVIAQFWSFANDLYTPEQGKRLFAIVGFGQSAGAVFGSGIAEAMVRPLGVYEMLLVAGGVLLLCVGLTLIVNARAARRTAAPAGERPRPDAAMEAGNGFRLVLRNRYLLLIGVLILLLNLVNTTGEYIVDTMVKEWAESAATAEVTARTLILGWRAGFYKYVNLVGMLIQLFLVSRIIRYLGVRAALLILPCIALGSYGLLALAPALAVLRVLKIAENATDYSLHNTLRNGVLFLPTTRAEKYKAKQAIDTFFYRAGDVLSALFVALGTNALALTVRGFATVNIVFATVWIGVALAIGRRFEGVSPADADDSE